jgi:hypothetical protein
LFSFLAPLSFLIQLYYITHIILHPNISCYLILISCIRKSLYPYILIFLFSYPYILSPYLLISLSHYLLISLSPYLLISLSPYLLVSLSPYLGISLSVYLFISLSLYLFISLSLYLFISLSLYLFISLSLYLFISLSIYLFISLSPYLLISLSPYLLSRYLISPYILVYFYILVGFSFIFHSEGEGAIPHFMEANPIAGLKPNYSHLPIIAAHNNTSFVQLIDIIVKSAVERIKK